MHRNRLSGLAVLFTLVLSPLAVFAQEDTATFTSENGLFSFTYPAEWVVQETEDFPYGATVADSEETMEEMQNEDAETQADPGQVGATIGLLPVEFLTSLGFEMEEEMSFEDVAEKLLEFLTDGEEGDDSEADMEATAEPGDVTLSEMELVEFESGAVAAIAEYTEEGSEGAIVVFMPADGVVGLLYLATAPGELTDELHATVLAIVESFEFTGTADDLMPMMPDTSSMDTSELDGNALVDERCTVCHDRGRIDSKDKDEAGWTATVDRMIGNGAQLNDDERQAVIDYLVETHSPRILIHEAGRSTYRPACGTLVIPGRPGPLRWR